MATSRSRCGGADVARGISSSSVDSSRSYLPPKMRQREDLQLESGSVEADRMRRRFSKRRTGKGAGGICPVHRRPPPPPPQPLFPSLPPTTLRRTNRQPSARQAAGFRAQSIMIR